MIPRYVSGFADDIKAMMEWRNTLGYKKESYSYCLKDFDRFCSQKYPEAAVLTWDIAIGFLEDVRKRRDNRCDVVALRNLGKYQIMLGKEACIFPAGFYSHKRRKMPYIMSDDDATRFFSACDQWPHMRNNPLLEYTVPVIFRLLYATGMRPQEARLLKREDVNTRKGTIYIADSKKHKDRLIAINDNVAGMCEKYNVISTAIYTDTEWFFPNRNKNPHRAASLQHCFHKCWEAAGNPAGLEYCTPYILRHNYATRMLTCWMAEGKDIDALIPYLSAYMGHETFRDTYYYIHLLPGRIAGMGCMDISDVVGEVDYEG